MHKETLYVALMQVKLQSQVASLVLDKRLTKHNAPVQRLRKIALVSSRNIGSWYRYCISWTKSI